MGFEEYYELSKKQTYVIIEKNKLKDDIELIKKIFFMFERVYMGTDAYEMFIDKIKTHPSMKNYGLFVYFDIFEGGDAYKKYLEKQLSCYEIILYNDAPPISGYGNITLTHGSGYSGKIYVANKAAVDEVITKQKKYDGIYAPYTLYSIISCIMPGFVTDKKHIFPFTLYQQKNMKINDYKYFLEKLINVYEKLNY